MNAPARLVRKLQKSLYGLKQASGQWNEKLTLVLTAYGFVQSKADYSLFTKHFAFGLTAILVYVDDLVLTGDELTKITSIKGLLDEKFSIKDIANMKFFLGMEIAWSKEGITLY